MAVVPTGLLALGRDVPLGGGLAPPQVKSQPPQDGHVVGGVAGADTALILPEGHVQDPVRAVFDAPVAAFPFCVSGTWMALGPPAT